jgi:hypothetical protein
MHRLVSILQKLCAFLTPLFKFVIFSFERIMKF